MGRQRERIDRICEICGVSFPAIPYRVRKGQARFCSPKCQGQYYHQIGHHPPPMLGITNPMFRQAVKIKCSTCAQEYERKPWQLRKRGKGYFQVGQFCSVKCRTEFMKACMAGKENPAYVGGELTYRGRDWLVKRHQVIERQQGKCAYCSRYVGESLPIHHVKAFQSFKKGQHPNSIDNLVGLCQPCHMKFERRRLL